MIPQMSKETTDQILTYLVVFFIALFMFKIYRLFFIMCLHAIESVLVNIFFWKSAKDSIETFFHKLYYFIETGKFKDPRRRFDHIFDDVIDGYMKK